MSRKISADLRFSRAHCWVRRAERGHVVVGATEYLFEQIGTPILGLELPRTGEKCLHDEPFGIAEGPKGVFDLVAPVGGLVIEVNREVLRRTDLLARSPFGEGWLMKVVPEPPQAASHLMDGQEYEEYRRSVSK